MRDAFLKTLRALVLADRWGMLLTADIGLHVFDRSPQNFPDQYGLSGQGLATSVFEVMRDRNELELPDLQQDSWGLKMSYLLGVRGADVGTLS